MNEKLSTLSAKNTPICYLIRCFSSRLMLDFISPVCSEIFPEIKVRKIKKNITYDFTQHYIIINIYYCNTSRYPIEFKVCFIFVFRLRLKNRSTEEEREKTLTLWLCQCFHSVKQFTSYKGKTTNKKVIHSFFNYFFDVMF